MYDNFEGRSWRGKNQSDFETQQEKISFFPEVLLKKLRMSKYSLSFSISLADLKLAFEKEIAYFILTMMFNENEENVIQFYPETHKEILIAA